MLCSSIPFVSSQWFSKSGNPDVLKLFHRHSVWMIRISVLVKVNGIIVKVNGIRHYSFIDWILPCFSHKKLASRAYYEHFPFTKHVLKGINSKVVFFFSKIYTISEVSFQIDYCDGCRRYEQIIVEKRISLLFRWIIVYEIFFKSKMM
jgi:hypothetical protein